MMSVEAATLTLAATDAGFVTEAGGSAKGDGTISPATYNYSVGREEHFLDGSLTGPIGYLDRKNYFVFDLSGVTGPIVSASLTVYMGPGIPPDFPGGEHGYESLDSTEIFEITEITDQAMALGLIDDLLLLNTTVGFPAFDEPSDPGVTIGASLYPVLGDGPLVLGMYEASSSDDGSSVTIPITAGGLGYLELFAGGPMVLSGSLPSAVGPPDPESQLIFGFTGPDLPGGDVLAPVLEITFVPEPDETLLTVVALAISMRIRRR